MNTNATGRPCVCGPFLTFNFGPFLTFRVFRDILVQFTVFSATGPIFDEIVQNFA